MNQQALYELAERELNIGRADPDVLATAQASSGGVSSLTRQLYWQYRSQKLRLLAESSGNPAEFWGQFVAEVEDAERKAGKKRSAQAWIGALACFSGWVLSYGFFRVAYHALATERLALWSYWIGSAICLLSGFYGFIVARRNSF